MSKISKKNAKIFIDSITYWLTELGATKVQSSLPSLWKTYKMDTNYGEITFNLPFKLDEVGEVYTLWGRFTDMDREVIHPYCNRHSGKYNLLSTNTIVSLGETINLYFAGLTDKRPKVDLVPYTDGDGTAYKVVLHKLVLADGMDVFEATEWVINNGFKV